MKAKLRFSVDDGGDDYDNQNDTTKQEKAQFATSRALAAYKERDANDYSMWAKWEPQDPVTLQENAERDALLEKQRNKEFEASNPDFCTQFKEDLEKRQRTKHEKERIAESEFSTWAALYRSVDPWATANNVVCLSMTECKQQGNQSYKRRQYKTAIHSYMQALDKSPFNVAVLTNLAQCHLRLDNLDDAVEFSSRALFVDPSHVKALSRRAAAWHLQKRWKDAALDMEKALELEPGNQDVVEQHSIIVGDYEDSIAQSQLSVKLANGRSSESDEERTKVLELQFVAELFKRMDDNCLAMEIQELQDDQQQEADDQPRVVFGAVHPSWIAYELVLPFLEQNESIRTLLRTSSELHKLCNRLVSVFEAEHKLSADKVDDSINDRELIVSAMINCAAAAMTNCPRNQIVMYQNASFRKCMLAALLRAGESQANAFKDVSSSMALPWSTRASIVRFFEEAIESKSWKRMMTTTKSVLLTLLGLIELSGDANQSAINNKSETLTSFDRVSKQNLILSVSSMCFTLSGDDHGIREFAQGPQDCIQAIAAALTNWKAMEPRLLSNLLGFLTNLSTVEAFRAAVEEMEATQRLGLIQDLLSIAREFAIGSTTKSSGGEAQQVTTAERALAALLNLSFHADACIRVDLIGCDFVTTLKDIFSAMDPGNFSKLVLILSRATSLLCRVHSVLKTATMSGTTTTSGLASSSTVNFAHTTTQLSDRDLLELLYRMCLQALSSTSNGKSDKNTAVTGINELTGETWQLCAQIWCHVGWCVHESHVREYLREKRAVHAMFQAIVVSNSQTEGYRSSSSQETSARERLVGNIVKVLITMQSDRNQQDTKLFGNDKNLKALVDALRSLLDGPARKNVAILLAKLCQADQTVKEQVRELRGIEMMLTVSQSLKTVGGKGLLRK